MLIVFLSASLLCASSPVLAQDTAGRDKKESAAKWETAHPRFLMGRGYFLEKKLSRAETELKACLEILPEHSDALFFLAQIDYQRGHFARALSDIERAEASHAAFAGADGISQSLRRKALLEERKKKEQEIAAMEEIFYSGSCKTDDEMLKIPESIEALRRNIQAINSVLNETPGIGPKSLPADYSYVHGNILFKLGRAGDAALRYLKAIESDSGHAGAFNNLISILYLAKDYGNALKYIGQAEACGVAINPKLKRAVLQIAKK